MKKVSAIALLVASVLAAPAVMAEDVLTLNPLQTITPVRDADGKIVEGLIHYEFRNDKSQQIEMGYKVIKEDLTFVDSKGETITIAGAGDKAEALQNNLNEYMNGNPTGKPETGDPILRPEPGKPQRPQPEGINPSVIEENRTNIEAIGSAFEQRVDQVNDYLSQAGTAIGNNSANIEALGNAFVAQAQNTANEITRLDGRIDSLEEKTDKLKAGIAGANAIASLSQYTGTGTHHVAIAVGGYDGEAAFAGGYTYALDKNSTIRATLSYDTEGEVGYGVSYGHSW